MMITYAQAPTPLTTRAPTIISPPPTSTLDVIGWLRTIAARTTALAGSRSAIASYNMHTLVSTGYHDHKPWVLVENIR